MKELKTLKDMNYEVPSPIKDLPPIMNIVSVEELKEAAIKWFLHGMKKRKNLVKMYLDFFNIEEEDLSLS